MTDHVLYLFVLIVLAGMAAGKLARTLRLPDVAVFLLAGMLLGQGLGWVRVESGSFLNQFILSAGSALILFDGGRNIRLAGLKRVWVTVALLSVPGVLISCALTALAAHALLGLDWLYALLLGAVIASTDPATLIPVFKQVRIRPKVRETVESESAFNDATGSILAFSLLAAVQGTEQVTLLSGIGDFLQTALGGIAVGAVIGIAGAFLAGHVRFAWFRDDGAILMLTAALSAYLVGDRLEVSGFMAAFVAGLIWGNAPLFKLNLADKRQEMDHVADTVTVIMRMLIFVLLGSQVNFAVIREHLWPALGVIAVFMLVARPLAVLACALPDRRARWERNELLFMFWVRETGVIPAALAGMLAGAGVAHHEVISAVTFLAVLLTILVQASTTGFAARRLGLLEGEDGRR